MTVEIRVPRPQTLKKYGLTEEFWRAILSRQNGACGACGNVPKSGKLSIDHEHVRGWKDMRAEDRTQYVRGLLCYMCNHYRLARGATIANLKGAAQYLMDYASRKTGRSHGVLVAE
jgi:hypothetical protein